MIKWFLIVFIILVLLLILVYNIINQNESKALYFPSKRCVWKPKTKYRSVFINVNDCDDVVYSSKHRDPNKEYISGWHFNNFPNAKTIMFCHGNTGNITHRRYIIDICHKFKLNLFVFDVRGFGKSDGFPHKLFLREDGEIVYHYLRSICKIPSRKLIVWGESLGGVTAVWTASQFKCGALILLCSFSSLDDAITYRFEGKSKTAVNFLTSLLSYKMDMIPLKHYLKNVTCPSVIIHSAKDDMIPYACSWINYHSIKHANKLHVRIKGGHSSPEIRSSQLREIFEFCDLSLDDLSEDVDISEILENLKTVAERYHNFID